MAGERLVMSKPTHRCDLRSAHDSAVRRVGVRTTPPTVGETCIRLGRNGAGVEVVVGEARFDEDLASCSADILRGRASSRFTYMHKDMTHTPIVKFYNATIKE